VALDTVVIGLMMALLGDVVAAEAVPVGAGLSVGL
jgi:hypothetical protein